MHDYAFVTYDPKTHERRYNVIVPRHTRFPTRPDLWKRQVVPTCSLGEPESLFKLLICELGKSHDGERTFTWDARGELHKLGGRSAPEGAEPARDNGNDNMVVVPLNEASPTLGYLRPPHQPGDQRPRLEVAFGINDERWLVATVYDLLTDRELMKERPVVKLV